MPRKARKISSINTYHIVVKGADKQLLFYEENDYIKYLEILEYYKDKHPYELLAFCLMSNHVHLLIYLPHDTISSLFQHINTKYAMWFNWKYKRTGFLQDGRFFSEPIESNRQLLATLKYIHYNPTKAGLEKFPSESYCWSSFYAYISSDNHNTKFKNYITNLVDIKSIMEMLGTQENFLSFHEKITSEDFLDINSARKRVTDDIALMLLLETTGCSSIVDFQVLSLVQKEKAIIKLKSKGLSIRQLNRITGVSIGVIQRICRKPKCGT